MLKRFFLLVMIGGVMLTAIITFSPPVAWASGGPPELAGVSALSARNVWAVGGTNLPATSGGLATLIEHWNGSSWQITPSPNVSGTSGPANFLNGVAAVPHDEDVWTVGRAIDQSGSFVTLTEAWNGAKWCIVSSPNL